MQPVGEYVRMGGLPVQVIGVLEPKGATSWGSDQDDIALVPVTTGFIRLFCQQYLTSITVRVADTAEIADTEAAVAAMLLERHGVEEFQVCNTAPLLETGQGTQEAYPMLLASVEATSPGVGGQYEEGCVVNASVSKDR